MKKTITYVLLAFTLGAYCCSCARGITPYEAANGKARCGRYIK